MVEIKNPSAGSISTHTPTTQQSGTPSTAVQDARAKASVLNAQRALQQGGPSAATAKLAEKIIAGAGRQAIPLPENDVQGITGDVKTALEGITLLSSRFKGVVAEMAGGGQPLAASVLNTLPPTEQSIAKLEQLAAAPHAGPSVTIGSAEKSAGKLGLKFSADTPLAHKHMALSLLVGGHGVSSLDEKTLAKSAHQVTEGAMNSARDVESMMSGIGGELGKHRTMVFKR